MRLVSVHAAAMRAVSVHGVAVCDVACSVVLYLPVVRLYCQLWRLQLCLGMVTRVGANVVRSIETVFDIPSLSIVTIYGDN